MSTEQTKMQQRIRDVVTNGLGWGRSVSPGRFKNMVSLHQHLGAMDWQVGMAEGNDPQKYMTPYARFLKLSVGLVDRLRSLGLNLADVSFRSPEHLLFCMEKVAAPVPSRQLPPTLIPWSEFALPRNPFKYYDDRKYPIITEKFPYPLIFFTLIQSRG